MWPSKLNIFTIWIFAEKFANTKGIFKVKVGTVKEVYYCKLNVCAPPPNPYVELLTPNVMVLGGGAFGR